MWQIGRKMKPSELQDFKKSADVVGLVDVTGIELQMLDMRAS